jgi:hypothetical protein
VLAPQARHRRDHATLTRYHTATDGDPLVHQCGLGDPPALADIAEAQAVRDPHVGEEDLVELSLAGELAQRAHLHAGSMHVAQKVGDAAMLGHVRVRPGDEDRPIRLVGKRGPYLLPVEYPLVAVAYRAGAEVGQVRARARLGEQLAPHLLAGPQWTQEPPTLLIGAVPQDRRRGHAEADHLQSRVDLRRAGGGERGVHSGLQRPCRAQPAQPDREVHPR